MRHPRPTGEPMKGICMSRPLATLLLSSLALASPAWTGTPAPASPFGTIIAKNGAIVVRLAQKSRWLVSLNSQPPRPALPEEAFTLRAADSLRLIERHVTLAFKPRFAPKPAGLMGESVVDRRSLGGDVERTVFFLPAQDAR